MLEKILNNPHYIMYAMIGVFIVVVIFLCIVARANARSPSSYEPTPRDRPVKDATPTIKIDGTRHK